MHFLASTRATGSSLEMLVVAIINQGIQAGSRFYIHTATPATISAIWSTERHKFFTAEVNGAITAITSFYIDFCMIIEHSAPFSPIFPLALRSLRRDLCPSRRVLCVFVVPVYRPGERFDVYNCRQFCCQILSLFLFMPRHDRLTQQQNILVCQCQNLAFFCCPGCSLCYHTSPQGVTLLSQPAATVSKGSRHREL